MTGGAPRRWLVKSEPDVYGFHDLVRDGVAPWDGVRNYQARNYLRDDLRPGDPVLFYHSSTSPPAVVGLAEVASAGYPDPTQFDPGASGYDAKATREAPRWYAVDLRPVRALARPLPLAELRADPALAGMRLLRRGNRLSVMPVDGEAFARILALSARPPR